MSWSAFAKFQTTIPMRWGLEITEAENRVGESDRKPDPQVMLSVRTILQLVHFPCSLQAFCRRSDFRGQAKACQRSLSRKNEYHGFDAHLDPPIVSDGCFLFRGVRNVRTAGGKYSCSALHEATWKRRTSRSDWEVEPDKSGAQAETVEIMDNQTVGMQCIIIP